MNYRSRGFSLLLLYFIQADAIEELQNNRIPDDIPTNANNRYSPKSLGTWSSISDVDTFFSRFNHASDYKDGAVELALGNYVTIQDGTYNSVWIIAGFDMEYLQTSADCNRYDNGHGICLIPQTQLTKTKWNASDTLTGAYMSSTMHTTYLPDVVTNLQNVLGSHIVQRNVLLSSSVDSNHLSNAYTWTTAYATLMSYGQMTGSFASAHNKYDDGEANYRLPIFNHMEHKTGSYFWTRNIWGHNGESCVVYTITDTGGLYGLYVHWSYGIRPLIYLR